MSDSNFTPEEHALLREMYEIKRKILKKVDPEAATKTIELEMALRTAESIENTMMKVKKMEQAREDDATDAVTLAVEILKRVSGNPVDAPNPNREPPMLEDIDVELVPGELEVGKHILDYKEVLKEEEND